MVLDPLSMRACDCGPSEGLLHAPRAGIQKNYSLVNYYLLFKDLSLLTNYL